MKDVKQIISECQNGTVSELVQILGVENTVRLIEVFGGSQVYIPRLETLTRNEYRNSMICTDCMNGMSYRAVASKYGLSEIAIRKIVKKEGKQKDERKHGAGAEPV